MDGTHSSCRLIRAVERGALSPGLIAAFLALMAGPTTLRLPFGFPSFFGIGVPFLFFMGTFPHLLQHRAPRPNPSRAPMDMGHGLLSSSGGLIYGCTRAKTFRPHAIIPSPSLSLLAHAIRSPIVNDAPFASVALANTQALQEFHLTGPPQVPQTWVPSSCSAWRPASSPASFSPPPRVPASCRPLPPLTGASVGGSGGR